MFPTFIGILDIQSWWEVPSIAHFCSLFRAAFNLLEFDIEDLEAALLTDGGTEGRLLQELIVRLLEGCLPDETRNDISTFNYQMFLRRLFRKKCQEYKCENPFNTDVDFELLPLRQKVEILRALCDFRLDAEDVECALSNLDSDSLRVEPLGHDRKKSAYWYFYGTRLYREDYVDNEESKTAVTQRQKAKGLRDKRRKRRRSKPEQELEENEEKENTLTSELGVDQARESVWQVVCFTQQDWTRLVDKFRESKHDTERKLFNTLAEDFLPEIPKLFELKEKQQRLRLLQRNNSRVIHTKESTEETIMVRSKMKTRVGKSTRKSAGQSSKSGGSGSGGVGGSGSGGDSDDEAPLVPLVSPPQKKGRQTNNSLASAVGQIVIHERDQIVSVSDKKGGAGKHGVTSYKTSGYPYTFGIEEEERLVGMHKVLESVKDHEDAWPFVDPVDEEYAPRYYSVVRKPMDLTTMEEKLEGRSYKNLNQFKRDFGLIVDNCRQYNGSDNEYTEMAVNLKEAFDRAVDRYLDSEPSSDECASDTMSPSVVPTSSPYPLRTTSPASALINSRKRCKKSNKKSKSNKPEKKSKGKSRVVNDDDDDDDDEDDDADDHEDDDENDDDDNNDDDDHHNDKNYDRDDRDDKQNDAKSARDRRGRKRSKRAKDEDERKNGADNDEESAISESAVIKSKRKKFNDVVQVLPKNKRLSAKDEKIEESKKTSGGGKKGQKETSFKNSRDHKENRKRKEDFEENHEPVAIVKSKSKRIEKKSLEESLTLIERLKKSKQKKVENSSVDNKTFEKNEENGKRNMTSDRAKKNRKKEKIEPRITRSEDKKHERKSPARDKQKKSKNKKEDELPNNGIVKNENDKNDKIEDTASKKFDSLLSNKDLESLDSLKDRISERTRRDEKLKLEREKLKKSSKSEGIIKKKVPSNGNTFNDSKVNLKRIKPKKSVGGGGDSGKEQKNITITAKDKETNDTKKNKITNVKHTKGSTRGESPAIQALNQATAQTLNDINKWLDDAPRLSEFSSGSDSPVFHPSTSELARPGPKSEVRKRPSTVKLFGPTGPPRPKKVQRTIDRLQPGKSKGNLLLKKPLSSSGNTSEITANQSASDVDQPNRDIDNEPKLSLGSVLKNADSIQLICKSLVSSPNANLSNEDEEDDRLTDSTSTSAVKENKDKESTKDVVTPKTKVESPQTIKESEEPQKPKSATPNLSAWFKAFGAPKSKKKEEEVEEVTPKREELHEVPQRQRRHSAGGSSVSESVSSFSQESPPGLTGRSPQTQPALTPTGIEQPVRAGFYQDALSTGSSPYNSPYYTTPPRYSAQLPPTPSPQNHPLSPAYPSSAAYDQNPLYPQIPQASHQVYQKPGTPENPVADTYNVYPQNSPQGDGFSQPTSTSPKPSPGFPQPSPQSLPAYPQASPQPPPSNYSQNSPQQPPNYSQPSPQPSAATNYSQPSPQQQHSPYSQTSPQPPPSYSQPSPQQPSSPYSQPSPKPPPSYSQVSPQTPSPYSQPSPQFTQPSPQPPPNYSQPSPQPPANYSQPSPQSHNFTKAATQQQPKSYTQPSPQPPPVYSQPSPQSLNYSQPSPQTPPNYSQHSPQSSTTSMTTSSAYSVQPPAQSPRTYPPPSQVSPCLSPAVVTTRQSQNNYTQQSPGRTTTPQAYAQSQKPILDEYQTTTPPAYPQGFKPNHIPYGGAVATGVPEPDQRVEYLKSDEKIQPIDPPIGLNANHQVYQSNHFTPPFTNNFPGHDRVTCAPVADLQRPTSRVNTQETPQQSTQERVYDAADSLKYPQQRQDQPQLLTFQQNLQSHEGIYQPAGGFQAPPYPMPNTACRPVYPSPHYYDASAKPTAVPPISVPTAASTLAPVKKRMYSEATGDNSRIPQELSRPAGQEQFSYDQMMTMVTSAESIVTGQYDGSFASLADTVAGNTAYARLGLGLVGRNPNDQQQLLTIPRAVSKDPLSYVRTASSSEVDLNLLQSIQSATKVMPGMQQSRREPASLPTHAPAPKSKKGRKKAAQQQQQTAISSVLTEQQVASGGMPGFTQYPGTPADVVGLKNAAVVSSGAFNFTTSAGTTNNSPFYEKDASTAAAFAFLDEFRNPNAYYNNLRQQQQQQQQHQQQQQQQQQQQHQQQAASVSETTQQANKLNNQPPRNYPPHPFLHSTQRSTPYGPPVSAYVGPHTPNLGVDSAAYQQYLHSLYALQPPTQHHRPSWL